MLLKKFFEIKDFRHYTGPPEKCDLSSKGHLTQNNFQLFSVLLHKNEFIPGVLYLKVKIFRLKSTQELFVCLANVADISASITKK
jgi:hypothetical protein